MCGIFGCFTPNKLIGTNKVEHAAALISHRGPDSTGISYGNLENIHYALAHTRLSIIDLTEHANQPMISSDGSYKIIFNGEIYNFRQLRKVLLELGYTFRTNSDTEVILHGYCEWGSAVLDKLNGMFAFVIVNERNQEVFFARDHFGIKPLYYHITKQNEFFIGSEIKSFFVFEEVPKQVNEEHLGEYLANLWVAEPHTLFHEIYKVPAGYCGYYNKNGITLKKYWDLPDKNATTNIANEHEVLDHITHKLQIACVEQLVSDVPVGVYVSGGIDSTAILNMVTKNTDANFLGLIAGFKEEDQKYEGTTSDLFYARKVLQNYPSVQKQEMIMEPDAVSHYKKLIWHMDEPIADPAIIPSYLLAKRSRELGSIVMLSGMGGDEVFCGYNRFGLIKKTMGVPSALGTLTKAAIQLSHLFPLNGKAKKTIRDLSRAAQFMIHSNSLGYQGLIGYMDPVTISALVGKESWISNYKTKYDFSERNDLGIIENFLYNDFKGFLASHNLIYSDKSSMAAGIEVRVPFLDKELVEYVWTLNSTFLLKNGVSKYPLKKALEKDVDKEILYRKKAGFSLPIRNWINKEIKTEIVDKLKDRSNSMYNYICFKEVEKILHSHYHKNVDRTMEIWILYTLSLWFEVYEL